MDYTRRNFIMARSSPPPVRPPWASERSILEACTSCGECAAVCPTGIVSLGEGNLPQLDFGRGECTFCGECARICAEDVFNIKTTPIFDHVAAIGEKCLARAGVECRACEDLCPEAAIRFRPRLGLPPTPELDASACTGCGACVAPCPADAIGLARTTTEATFA